MTTAQIADSRLRINPSKSLSSFIRSLSPKDDTPVGILNLNSNDDLDLPKRGLTDHVYLLNEADHIFINGLGLDPKAADSTIVVESKSDASKNKKLLTLEDLYWVYKMIEENNSDNSKEKIYFHEIFEGSEIILPQNAEIPRNPELEKRCNLLKAQQQNRQYKAMTKNVDNVRQKFPEDTIAYQMKQLNKHLIAVAQFILSVVAGFAFGFIGVELLVGRLDFGFRLLLGIICGLTVALAELYFLAKKLNEDINFTLKTEELNKTSKLN